MKTRNPTLAAAALGTLFTLGAARPAVAGSNTWTTTGPPVFGVSSLAVPASQPGVLYAGLKGTYQTTGFRSSDSGLGWTELPLEAPDPFGDAETVFALAPTDDTRVYAGNFGGIFSSSDSGLSWTKLGFPDAVHAIAFPPGSTGIIWIGTDFGVQRSFDSGKTWSAAGHLLNLPVRFIVFDPSDASHVYIDYNGRLLTSVDGGTSWSFLDDALPPGFPGRAVCLNPGTPSTVYFGRDDGVYRSTDSGAHWTGPAPTTAALQIRTIVVDPVDPTHVYAGTAENGLYESTDSGGTFAPLTNLCSSLLDAIWIDPSDHAHLLAGGGGGLFESANGGSDWAALGAPAHFGDVSRIVSEPGNPQHLFAATVGRGVWTSPDDAGSWTSLCDPLRDSNVLALAVAPSAPGTIYAGTANGVSRSVNGGANWSDGGLSGDSIASIAVDPTDGQIVFAGNAGGADASPLFRSGDGGQTWLPAGAGIPDGAVVRAIAIAPSDPSIIYFAVQPLQNTGRIFKSTDSGASAQATSIWDVDIESVTVDAANPEALFAVGGEDSYRSTDGGSTSNGLGSGGGGTVVQDPSSPSTIYVGSNLQVAKTIDGGGSWRKWSASTSFASSMRALLLDASMPGRLLGAFFAGGAASFDQVAPQITNVTPATGNTTGGDLLTIHGSFFMQESEVIFDGAPLTPISVSDSEIVVVSPPHPAGTVGLMVVNPTFLSANLDSAFDYVCVAPFTAIVQGSTTICSGGGPTPIKVFLSGVPPWTVHWMDDEIDQTSDSVFERDVSPAATTTYSLVSVSDSSGCAAGSPSGSAVITVVDPPPPPDITAPSSVPAGASNVSASVPVAASTGYSWTLSGAFGNSNLALSSITFTPVSPGVTVRLQVVEQELQSPFCFTAPAVRLVQTDFLDVPPSNVFHNFVDAIAEHGVTEGCDDQGDFCPDAVLPRAQMAALLARAHDGSEETIPVAGTIGSSPYDCEDGGSSYFADVAPTDLFCKHIHRIASLGITVGCDATPDFCPNDVVTRGTMAIFMARVIAGSDGAVPSAYGPDGVTGRSYDCGAGPVPFSDVPAGSFFCRHVNYIWAKGIVDGFPDGTFQPNLSLTRGQTAKFIANTFGLTLGP